MTQFSLKASKRSDVGKGASRRLRRNEQIPGIIYGGGKDPQSIILEHKQVMHALEDEKFYSHILDIDVEGDKERAVLKDLQRHPYKPRILHLDLLRVSSKEMISMTVPLHFAGSELCPGVKVDKGVVSRLLNEVQIRCLPQNLPEAIDVDLSKLALGDTVHLSDLALPKDTEIVGLEKDTDSDLPVVTIVTRKEEEVVEVEAPVSAEVETIAEAKAKEEEGEAAES